MDEKKKLPDEEEKKTPDTHEEKKDEPKAEEKPADKADENSADNEQPAVDDSQADENGEGADKPAEDKQEQPSEDKSDKQDSAENAPDEKDQEILRLKTQIAAMQLGIKPDCIEDAVAVAESYVRNGSQQDINAALSAVVKKYPDMKGEGDKKSDGKKQGGFKVGAGSSDTDEKKPQSKPTAEKRWNKFK
jgi:hypothetical protein